MQTSVGIIGGSGLYDMPGLVGRQNVTVETPYGAPSDELVTGTIGGVPVAFLPRHGRGHRISPSELPSQANVWAMKQLGVTHLLSISAVGSLRQHLAPRDVVIPDQLIDRTKGVRPPSFFDRGLVVHISMADPYCPELCQACFQAAESAGAHAHNGGTLVVMEGPQFSTRAESHFYRQIGGDLIGMTALPEAKLAREAELCYTTVAMVTDYDCWHEEEEVVSSSMVVENLRANVDLAKALVQRVVPAIAQLPHTCGCQHALEHAIITAREAIPPERARQLDLLVGKYLRS
ncbi:MAG: S-methyl-5'-thioadenosine phosphorylase [Chloroflexi bacterium]|nr:S-methyl-5'-thioadenosine phosphorylase [Chloroflexota bacterium]